MGSIIDSFDGAIQKRIKEAGKFLDVDLDIDVGKLKNQITLGNDWDDPKAISKALDTQPQIYAYWSTLLVKLKREMKKIEMEFNSWKSMKKIKIRKLLVEKYVTKDKMTRNNANKEVTAGMVEDYFNSKYNYSNRIFVKKVTPLDDITKAVSEIEIIVSAFKQRKDLLTYLALMVKTMIEKDIWIKKPMRRKKDEN